MYYTNPPQSYTQPNRLTYAEVQNMQKADRQYAGWRATDAQQSGGRYRVHMCDSHGQYHTLTMDGNGNVLQNQNGYR